MEAYLRIAHDPGIVQVPSIVLRIFNVYGTDVGLLTRSELTPLFCL